MSLWLIGNKGMLGNEVEKLLKRKELPYLASDIEVDITDKRALQAFIADHKNEHKNIDWIINCSGYTAVDRAEDDTESALRINAHGVQNIAETAKDLNAGLIHISTDYVFNGEKTSAYLETDVTNPLGVYGSSKLEGEKCIIDTFKKYYILRTAWLFGKQGNNFVKTMLTLLKEKDTVKVVEDQWGSPTYAADLAGGIISIIENGSESYGTYHFTNEGRTNWYEFAREIHRLALDMGFIKKKVRIVPVGTEQFPTRARRPQNSYLSKEKIKQVMGISIRNWQEALKEFITDFKEGV